MSEDFEIKNKVTESGLVNFDLSELSPKGKRIGIDLKDFLFMEMILKEKDFREKVAEIDSEIYRDAYVYVYCSVDAIVPIWAYFLIFKNWDIRASFAEHERFYNRFQFFYQFYVSIFGNVFFATAFYEDAFCF